MLRKRSAPLPRPEGTPVIRASICTGEQVAGFKDGSGRFHEVMLLRTDADRREFLTRYGLEEHQVRREW